MLHGSALRSLLEASFRSAGCLVTNDITSSQLLYSRAIDSTGLSQLRRLNYACLQKYTVVKAEIIKQYTSSEYRDK